jgi:ABC-type lipoprotein export system ATPase subunit
MQRAAIARALVHRPVLLVADEPTGNLDSANGARTLELLAELHRETRVSILLATHADDVAARADRIVRMKDGQIESESRRTRVEVVADPDVAEAADTADVVDSMPGGRSRS